METRSISLVQISFEDVVLLGEKVAEIFYDELFAVEPGLKKMFKGDMAEQRRKLLTTLALVVRSLHEPQRMMEPMKALAKRHVGYGVEPSHYTYVGNALIRTLQKGLGDRFTPELQQAWVEAYTMIANIMKSAAYG